MSPKRVFLSLSSPFSSTPLDTLLASSTPQSFLFSLAQKYRNHSRYICSLICWLYCITPKVLQRDMLLLNCLLHSSDDDCDPFSGFLTPSLRPVPSNIDLAITMIHKILFFCPVVGHQIFKNFISPSQPLFIFSLLFSYMLDYL